MLNPPPCAQTNNKMLGFGTFTEGSSIGSMAWGDVGKRHDTHIASFVLVDVALDERYGAAVDAQPAPLRARKQQK